MGAYEWPDPLSGNCNLDEFYSLGCELLLEAFDIPHQSLINPVTGEIVPKPMIVTGQLQDELGGMHLNIESFEDMPEGLAAPKRGHWQDESDRRSNAATSREPGQRKCECFSIP